MSVHEDSGEAQAVLDEQLVGEVNLFGDPTPSAGAGEAPEAGAASVPGSEAAGGAGDDLQAVMAILEALLFVSHGPVTLERLYGALHGVQKTEVRQALRQLADEYGRAGRGLQIAEVAGGYQMVTRPDHAPWIKRLERSKPAPKLSRSALEVLAIVAYKQPLVRAEIEQIRGVDASGVLRTLLERKLIRQVGRKEAPGRPTLYGTTKFFLQHFGLRDLAELPPLREFKELGEAEQALLPVGDSPLVVGDGPSDEEPTAETYSSGSIDSQ